MEETLTTISVILASFAGISLVLSKAIKDIAKVIADAKKVPDQGVEGPDSLYPSTMPDQGTEMPDLSEEDMREILGSEELQMKNKLFDEKIELLKQEVKVRPGELYDEDHNVIAGEYIPKPTHEYAE